MSELRALGDKLRDLSRNLRRWGPGVVGSAITGMENVADRLDALADEAERISSAGVGAVAEAATRSEGTR
jgi:hypothetical protein